MVCEVTPYFLEPGPDPTHGQIALTQGLNIGSFLNDFVHRFRDRAVVIFIGPDFHCDPDKRLHHAGIVDMRGNKPFKLDRIADAQQADKPQTALHRV